MYKEIEAKDKIVKYQKIFLEILQNGICDKDIFSNKIKAHKGYKKVYWSSHFNFWSASDERSNKKKNGKIDILQNMFGLEKPGDKELTITVDINFPLHGEKTGGILIEDDKTGQIFVGHRGANYIRKINSKKNRGMFWNAFKDKCKEVGRDREKVIIIGEIEPLEKSKYKNFQNKIKDFVELISKIKKDVDDGNIKDNDQIPTKALNSTKKKKTSQKQTSLTPSQKPDDIIRQSIDKIIEINQNCRNYKKKPIFKESEIYKLSRKLEKLCISEESFISFSLTLYKLMYETTRIENPNFKNKNGRKYIFLLPDNFLKIDTKTKHFMDIVGALRHHYAHLEPEYKVPIKKISYSDVLQELKNSRNEPKTREEFTILQNELLKLFDNSLEYLL